MRLVFRTSAIASVRNTLFPLRPNSPLPIRPRVAFQVVLLEASANGLCVLYNSSCCSAMKPDRSSTPYGMSLDVSHHRNLRLRPTRGQNRHSATALSASPQVNPYLRDSINHSVTASAVSVPRAQDPPPRRRQGVSVTGSPINPTDPNT
jgi:hypothetical protein